MQMGLPGLSTEGSGDRLWCDWITPKGPTWRGREFRPKTLEPQNLPGSWFLALGSRLEWQRAAASSSAVAAPCFRFGV